MNSNADWLPSFEREQGELLEPGDYECVIAEIPKYYKDVNHQGLVTRKLRAHASLEVDAVTKDGKRFVVTTKAGHPSFDPKSNLITDFCSPLGITEEQVKAAGGFNKLLVGRGVRVRIKRSVPQKEGGLQYNNVIPGTFEWSENGLKVSSDFKTQSEMFPASKYSTLAEYEAAKAAGIESGDDDDPFGQ